MNSRTKRNFLGLLALMSSISLAFLNIACQSQTSPSRKGSQSTRSSAAETAGGKETWVQFQDPYEHAFRIEVPQGWIVKGGLYRLGFSDVRPMVDLQSPDGKINVRLGDVAIPSYVIPVQLHNREGEPYDLGAQAQMVVSKYYAGPQFAVLYSHARFNKVCANPQPASTPAESSITDYLPADPNTKAASSGQITYRCDTPAGAGIAFAYTRTALYGTLWQAPDVVSFLAPSDQASVADIVMRHCAQTFKINPQWLEYQKRMDAEGLEYQRARQQQRMQQLQQQVQQFEAKMQALRNQVNSFEAHQAQERKQFESFDDALNGVTPTIDPVTGETRKVWTGTQSNYWVNGLGQVVNSNSNPAPNQNWRQLQIQPN